MSRGYPSSSRLAEMALEVKTIEINKQEKDTDSGLKRDPMAAPW
jgi:hypothetical protein